ncbi:MULTISPECIES: DoxX family membrane protein [unclassified Streptomyces]|uniref:DoxX family membrane protein n=1 Tax=unclassified Streptomyces TaxID=2593676 RepID=UPI001F048EE6|nr:MULTISPECIES: DoxX family membrane protein [unclassified Streptomyces]MCH0561961.1 DoxX family membrane protein [Streptomyces sp. MUM 2J]MCH0567966.1 DoxX family membrane protein [Streptomyces sp. MUM 136J]
MSVDTRTPRTPTGDRSSGFDDAPALSMVKVPSDPAQIIVNHASFRVQLGASAKRTQSPRVARHPSATDDTARIPLAGATAGRTPAAGARRRPVVWSGRSAPDDTGAHRLLQAVRAGSVGHDEPADAGATQVIPRVDGTDPGYGDLDATVETPVVGAQRTPVDASGARLLPAMRTVGSAYEEPGYGDGEFEDFDETDDARSPAHGKRHVDDPARHAYYPGRRMNLGVVLLPLRIFLGFISVYAGMGKLCDPVYFDGGKRGSMVTWLNTLHPWQVAEPLRQFALHHPVGSGLVIAFLQVVVGVLTVLGCWQRVAAVVGALLSAALLVTVSWKSVPVYDTPDIIYLAAWSPLIIAGAPVYSIDGRLAASAWRRLGPRSDIWELRRYVLRRGALITAIVTGLTLLLGSLLGGAVRDSDRVVVPGPGEAPRNELPGSPLPQEPGRQRQTRSPSAATTPTQDATSAAPATEAATAPGATRGPGTATTGAPSQTQGTTGQAPPQQSSPAGQAPSTSSGPTSGGTATSGTSGGGTDPGPSSSDQSGLVGGLLG